MSVKHLLVKALLLLAIQQVNAQTYPVFGAEKKVSINGLTFDAMEPFISPDGYTLFFNSLNSGGNTNLYYASKIDDTTFTYVGLVGGTYDPSPNHLDAVASIDSSGDFFWTSLRGYPSQMENLQRGVFNAGTVSMINRVHGTFNIFSFNYPFGWLIMDAAINYRGDQLYFCNAEFDFSNTTCAGVPCEAKLGVAQKVNDSTFNKVANSDAIFTHVNDTVNYITYAPQVTKDGLELYYTRLQKGTSNTEICVSVRNSVLDTFSLPMVIYAKPGFAPEAASPSTDKQKIYYHQKDGTGVFRVYMRYRTAPVGIGSLTVNGDIEIYPNPTNSMLYINMPLVPPDLSISVYSPTGNEVLKTKKTRIDISGLANGIYFLIIREGDKILTRKFIKN